ncbi:protein kinase domain-containing protein [Phormidium sp. CCY1219]|uniref:protein kinase domain-containing protein n=1 Tax=Phormidium sp. CCY1219 TaxID=2886104 RepID=UPI002D1EC1AE|nr:AAA family ATPase [Phormidium sp. CCY1219]MEB3831862.1 AAA family ATPase [Phormidium sp. CCY1219]
MIAIPGIAIREKIYESARSIVYRGIRERDPQPIVVKVLRADYPSAAELSQYQQEYEICAGLGIEGAIAAYSLENYRNKLAIIFEDFGGISLKQILEQRTFIVQEFLAIAIKLAETLGELHGKNIIHKDINPANIVVNPDSGEVKLIDFGIATIVEPNHRGANSPHAIEGTLAYMSPEQTGRMNRSLDYRSDFYSLGVTFYELLVHQLPFEATEAMELVHCHLAKQPKPPHEINPEIPLVLSQIVMKLLAKTAEERYQSAWGLQADLVICMMQLEATGEIEDLIPGENDVCGKFQILPKLYGREAELQRIIEAFERVAGISATPSAKRHIELMLVSGYAGIGKTALVQEMGKLITGYRSYFISGKFEPLPGNHPYCAIIQALQKLVGQLLTESDSQLEKWREKLHRVLGENARAIVEVIPELELIVGEQPSGPQLPPGFAQARFKVGFQNLIQAFAVRSHPLVLFLDDLQWADAASLSLIHQLMTAENGRSLLLIGAYRDRELSPEHPVMETLEAIEQAGVPVNRLQLEPLKLPGVTELIADTLQCSTATAKPLGELVVEKTQGNPFFITEFLHSLYEEGAIAFDLQSLTWEWFVDRIQAREMTDNVVDLLSAKIQKLRASTQAVLKVAACIGDRFDLEMVLTVSGEPREVVTRALQEAIAEGLVVPSSDSVGEAHRVGTAEGLQFAHNRIYEAAYALISDAEKYTLHRKVGECLLERTPSHLRDETLFEIVSQLNFSRGEINARSQKEELARLNLRAGRKAKAAAAYEAARSYFTIGRDLLEEESWGREYNLALDLHEEATEVAYLCGNLEEMSQLAEIVRNRARSAPDKVKVYQITLQARMGQTQQLEAVRLGLEMAEQLGISFPSAPAIADIEAALARTKSQMQAQTPADLLQLPPMGDAHKLAAMQILSSLASASYQAAPQLFPLVVFQQVQLSLAWGNCSWSAFAYANYGVILCDTFGEIDLGYRFGELAIALLEQRPSAEIKTKIIAIVAGLIGHWKRHLKDSLPQLRAAERSRIETGDLEWAAYAAKNHCQNSFLIGKPLLKVERDLATCSETLAQLHQTTVFTWNEMWRQLVLNLVADVEYRDRLIGEAFNAEEWQPALQSANDRNGLHYLFLCQLILAYLFERFPEALQSAIAADEYLDGVTGLPVVPVFYFYDSLTRLALYETSDNSQRQALLDRVANNQEKMQRWATHAPMNYAHKYYLVEAERYRLQGDKLAAMDEYDRAIELAQKNEYLNEEALGNELAAKFYRQLGKITIAKAYMQESWSCYLKWGASSKVKQLEENYPQLLAIPYLEMESMEAGKLAENRVRATGRRQTLDVTTVMKASQAIASEIVLDKLLASLMNTLLENAGAQKGVLILVNSGKLLVAASASVDATTNLEQPIPVEEYEDLPLNLIKYVERTRSDVVLSNAAREGQFTQDSYIAQRQLKSALCSAIVNGGKAIAVLYLENNLTTGAFTPQRLEILRVLSAQAAISLENAMLYTSLANAKQQLEEYSRTLEVKVEERTRELKAKEVSLAEAQRLAKLGSYEYDVIADAITWSEELYCILGLDRESPIPSLKEHQQLIHPEDLEFWFTTVQQCIETGCDRELDYRIIRPDGHFRYVSAKIKTTANEAGRVIKLFGTIQDITERKLTEEALRRSEAQLREQATELEQTLQQLQRTQAQLIQTEKMSGLGQLVAGVAHEINNPIGFIYGNIEYAGQYVEDLLNLIQLYQQHYTTPMAEIQEEMEAIDLEFIARDLPHLLASIKNGADRIHKIVRGLQNFSRHDESEMKPVDIHEGIESTLLVLQSRLKLTNGKSAIQVVKDYGNLPKITCYASELNQVFMNVLSNAIDALHSLVNGHLSFVTGQKSLVTGSNDKAQTTNDQSQMTIRIRTESTPNDTVKISIADNGMGMSDRVRQRIFDPFFTTKPVGSGTGLGLWICYSIVVERHGGEFSCISAPGEGAEFIIEIPVRSPNKK